MPTDPSLWDFARAEDFWELRAVLLANAFNKFLRDSFAERNGIGWHCNHP